MMWRLVWCWERCYKTESAELKQDLESCAKKFKGSLSRVKKAKELITLLMQKDQPTVVVLDWREAKPFKSMLASNPTCKNPLAIVIHCSTGCTAQRARKWIDQQSGLNVPFLVCCDLNDLEQLFATTIPIPSAPAAPGTPHMLTKPLDLKTEALPGCAGVGDAGRDPTGKQTPCVQGLAMQFRWMHYTMAMGGCKPQGDMEEMARLLRAAMPSHYED